MYLPVLTIHLESLYHEDLWKLRMLQRKVSYIMSGPIKIPIAESRKTVPGSRKLTTMVEPEVELVARL